MWLVLFKNLSIDLLKSSSIYVIISLASYTYILQNRTCIVSIYTLHISLCIEHLEHVRANSYVWYILVTCIQHRVVKHFLIRNQEFRILFNTVISLFSTFLNEDFDDQMWPSPWLVTKFHKLMIIVNDQSCQSLWPVTVTSVTKKLINPRCRLRLRDRDRSRSPMVT